MSGLMFGLYVVIFLIVIFNDAFLKSCKAAKVFLELGNFTKGNNKSINKDLESILFASFDFIGLRLL